jgi:hypothetical protein
MSRRLRRYLAKGDRVAAAHAVAQGIARGDVGIGEGRLLGPGDYLARMWHVVWARGHEQLTVTLVRRQGQWALRGRVLFTDHPSESFSPTDSRMTTVLQVSDEEAGLWRWREMIDAATQRFGPPESMKCVVIQSKDPNVIAARLIDSGVVNVAFGEESTAPS